MESLRSVLLHEDAHCRRHDVAFAYLGRLALVLFFFHPLVWLLNRRLAETAELAADEAVLAAGIPASSYRRTLARRDEVTSARLERFRGLLAPGGAQQERVLCFASFAARVGLRGLVERIVEAYEPWSATQGVINL